MPVTINLSTMPGIIKQHDGYSATEMELFGAALGRETVAVSTVSDVGAAVQAFGTRIRAVHPDSSFRVLISIKKGERKPRGYDKAYLNNGYGQENYLRVIDARTKVAAHPVDACAIPTTPAVA